MTDERQQVRSSEWAVVGLLLWLLLVGGLI